MIAVPEDMVPPPPPAWSVLMFTFSDRNTDSELVVMCKKRRFIIRMFADNFVHSSVLRDRYLFFLEVAENFELDGYTVEDFYDWIVEPLLPIFGQLPEITGSTLQEFFFPETDLYTLRADGETMKAILCDEKETPDPVFGVYLPENICTSWPLFKPHEIWVRDEVGAYGTAVSLTPREVVLKDGSIAFLKLLRRGDRRTTLHEDEKYKTIHDSHLDESLRILRLLGLVRDGDGQVFGLLGGSTLLCATKPETPKHLRQRWVTQVHDISTQLHTAGIVWGDAKPDNVLIDHDDNAWVIDFGGGYTVGWVSKELEGTVEGDNEALQKIIEFCYRSQG